MGWEDVEFAAGVYGVHRRGQDVSDDVRGAESSCLIAVVSLMISLDKCRKRYSISCGVGLRSLAANALFSPDATVSKWSAGVEVEA